MHRWAIRSTLGVVESNHGASPADMRAMRLDSFGADLREVRLPRPDPAAGEVLVRVAASGVNPLDVKIRDGAAGHAQVVPPLVLGIDLAGRVEAVGPQSHRFRVGDEVYGMVGGVGERPGSLAEFAAVDERLLGRAPRRLTARQAAALPLAAVTAWEGLVDRAKVSAGATVLVHGGAGGVGSVAVQLARAYGARVFATVRPRSFSVVREMGAQPIDRDIPVAGYVSQLTDGRGFDIVFDTVGGQVLDASFEAVKRYVGHVVSILGWGRHLLAPLSFRGATYSGVFTLLPLLTGEGLQHHGDILAAVATLVDDGEIEPRLSPSTYRLSDVQAAHLAVRLGPSGKVVVEIAGGTDE